MQRQIPVYGIALPEYRVGSRPDCRAIGARLDRKLREHFAGHSLVVRGITVDDHPGKSLDDLVAIVRRLGHDRYDPGRRGVHYPEDPQIDMHADLWAGDGLEMMQDMIGSFYEGPPADRNGPPIRLDLLMLYDSGKLEYVPFPDWENSCMYRFRDPSDKAGALRALVKILR